MSFAIGTLKVGLIIPSLEERLDGFLQLTPNQRAAFAFFDDPRLDSGENSPFTSEEYLLRWPEFDWTLHPIVGATRRLPQASQGAKRQKLDDPIPVPAPPPTPHKANWLERPVTTGLRPKVLFATPERFDNDHNTVDEDPDLEIAETALLEHQNRILTKANIDLERRLEVERQRVKLLLQQSRSPSYSWPCSQELTVSSTTPPPPKPNPSPIRNASMFLLDFVESLEDPPS